MVARGSGNGQRTGPLIGIGIDLVEIDRMRELLDRRGDAFVTKVFAIDERLSLSSPKAPAHYAARFAAKEAFMKALGTGLAQGIRWHDVAVVRAPSGAPGLRLEGAARDLSDAMGVGRVHLSLTHSRQTAAAVVVLES